MRKTKKPPQLAGTLQSQSLLKTARKGSSSVAAITGFMILGEKVRFRQPDKRLACGNPLHKHEPYPHDATNLAASLGEAYIHGFWTTPDLTAVTKIIRTQPHVLRCHGKGVARLALPA